MRPTAGQASRLDSTRQARKSYEYSKANQRLFR